LGTLTPNRGGKRIRNSEEKPKEGTEVKWSRILNTDLFLYLLDLEVKRARRYQNFLSILILKLNALSNDESGDLQTSYQMLANLLTEEIRETDILGHLSKNKVGVLLPYADALSGGYAKSRVEDTLKYCDFKSKGFEVMIDQINFPMHGTNTISLMKRAFEAESS
jgi:GGDEF domain-containing protein